MRSLALHVCVSMSTRVQSDDEWAIEGTRQRIALRATRPFGRAECPLRRRVAIDINPLGGASLQLDARILTTWGVSLEFTPRGLA